MPTPAPAASNQWPFFLPDPQRPSAPVVLVQHQTAPASVNSFEVNNLIMSSQQKPDSLMTSHELNRKVDQQIKQHWFLLGERTPPASPRPSPPTAFAPLPPPHPNTHHHHHHPHPHQHQHQSHSTNSSPNPSNSRKKSVCFNDSSSLRRYSVDDLDISRQTTPLKSCLKSSVTLNDGRYSPIDMNRSVQTQATSMDTKPRPSSAVLSSHVHRSSSVPSSVEHWHARQLKSAPRKKHTCEFIHASRKSLFSS